MVDVTIPCTVHSSVVVQVAAEMTINGTTVMGTVPRLEIEVVWDDGEHGHTFRLPVMSASDLEAAQVDFATGNPVRLTISKGDKT